MKLKLGVPANMELELIGIKSVITDAHGLPSLSFRVDLTI